MDMYFAISYADRGGLASVDRICGLVLREDKDEKPDCACQSMAELIRSTLTMI